MLKVYTSRISYNGENKLDISVKSGIETFAPTWDIVLKHKDKKITNEQYTQTYLELIRKSYKTNKEEWIKLLNQEEIVLCCYCKSGEFCHRYILADILVKLGAKYLGEI